MDLKQAHSTRWQIVKILEASQSSEANALERAKEASLAAYRELLTALTGYLQGINPTCAPSHEDIRAVASFSKISLKQWVQLQADLHTTDQSLATARRDYDEAHSRYNSMVGFLGGGFAWIMSDPARKREIDEAGGALNRATSDRQVLETRRANTTQALRKICKQFVLDATTKLDKATYLPRVGPKIKSLGDGVARQASTIWNAHVEYQLSELARIERLVSSLKNGYLNGASRML